MKKQIIAVAMLVGMFFAGNVSASNYQGRLVGFVVSAEFVDLLPQLNAVAIMIDTLNNQGVDMVEINKTFESIFNAIVNSK